MCKNSTISVVCSIIADGGGVIEIEEHAKDVGQAKTVNYVLRVHQPQRDRAQYGALRASRSSPSLIILRFNPLTSSWNT